MYGEIRIGEKTVPMLALASADIYYKQIFREDPVKIQASGNYDAADAINLFMRMGFVMAKYAELKSSAEMRKLNEDNFTDWLDQFDRGEFYSAIEDIKRVYEGQKVGTSESKNA